MTTHRENALEHLSNVEGAQAHLETLYRIPSDRRPAHIVAQAHEDSRSGVKLAQVEALLEIGEQLAALNMHLAVATRPDAVFRLTGGRG